MNRVLCLLAIGVLAGAAHAAASNDAPASGILLLAHGGKPEWNQTVTDLAKAVDRVQPTEVAFGMADKDNIQAAADRLIARGVSSIVAVPLFVSSHSSVVRSTEYLLGLRPDAPADLARFARMSHGPAASAHAGHDGHGSAAAPSSDRTAPIRSKVPIRMTDALNRHPVLADVLLDRTRSISRDPANEVVIVIAHGPVPDDDDKKWLADMEVIAERLRAKTAYRRIETLTLRDDAPKAVRDAASQELRRRVERATGEGRRVLIVPLLLSFGGIEAGVRTRLEGLTYTMASQALLPDDRFAGWILEAAAASK